MPDFGAESHGIVTEGVVGSIYFIRAGRDGPIKVGYSSNVRRRLSTLQMGNPDPLHLLYSEPGTMRDEAGWHILLEEYRIRGEWFAPNQFIAHHLNQRGVQIGPISRPPEVRVVLGEGPLKRHLREKAERRAQNPAHRLTGAKLENMKG